MMAPQERNGRVVTFYSYKGGTGRSMALSNIAWVLASAGKRVLVIDWDLEAPGLHRYFRPFLIDPELGASEGLMDLIDRYASEAIRPPPEGESLPPDWWWPLSDISEHVLGINHSGFPAGGGIDLLPAGLQCDTYAVKVSAFNWQNFFDRLGGGGFLDAVRQRAKAEYDYVLIDSRTGVSDTAGICTAQLPDTLVVCFTYNNQSVKGAAAVAASARRLQAGLAEERRLAAKREGAGERISDSPLPFRIYPVPMRVDAGESDRLALRQAFAREAFADLLSPGTPSEQAAYWAAVEVPHRVFYAYEEVLAPFKDDANDPKTVLAAFVRMTREITGGDVADYRLPIAPEERQRLLDAYAETPQSAASRQATVLANRETEDQALTRHVETVLQSLGDDERAPVRSVLGRLVRVGREDEGGGLFPIRVAMAEIDADQRSAVGLLAQRSVLAVATEQRVGHGGQAVSEQTVALSPDRLLQLSPTLQRWLAEDREFLLWRQQLRAYRSDWARSGDRGALLSGSPLAEARLWQRKRPQDLNEAEQAYIDASIGAAEVTLPPTTVAAPARPSAQPVAEAPDRAGALAAAPRRWGLGAAMVALLFVAAAGWGLQRKVSAPPPLPVDIPNASAPVAAPAPPAAELARLVTEADRLFDAGQLAEAEAAYSRVLAQAPDQLQAMLQLGRINDINGNFAASADWYRQAIALRPDDAAPLIERAASLMDQRSFDKALTDLDLALAKDPKNALAHFNRGVAHENLGRPDQALADYTQAVALNQGLERAYLRRAALLEKTDPAKARADYQSVLGLPDYKSSVQTAQQRLKALGAPAKVAAAPGQRRAFIQYSDAADKAAVEALRKGLAVALAKAVPAIALPGIEKVSVTSAGEVRYFFADDRDLAETVDAAAEEQLARNGTARSLRVTFRDAKAFPNAVPGTVELWLPSLSIVAHSRAQAAADAVKK